MIELGDFTLHSGKKSWWKIILDNLTDEEIYHISEKIVEVVGPYSMAVSVPTGGDRLAQELNCWPLDPSAPVLIVDDVYTTGESIKKIAEPFVASGIPVKGVVVFTRNSNLPEWVQALFLVTELNG